MANQILKSDIKIGVYRDLGRTFTNFVTTAQNRVQQIQGAKQELAKAAANIHAMTKVAEQELDEGKIKDLEQLEIAKRFIARAAASLENHGQHLDVQLFGMAGKVQAYKDVANLVEKSHESELERLRGIQAMLESGAVAVDADGSLEMKSQADIGRIPGTRPAATDIQQRKAEAKAEKEAAAAEEAKPRRKRRAKE